VLEPSTALRATDMIWVSQIVLRPAVARCRDQSCGVLYADLTVKEVCGLRNESSPTEISGTVIVGGLWLRTRTDC